MGMAIFPQKRAYRPHNGTYVCYLNNSAHLPRQPDELNDISLMSSKACIVDHASRMAVDSGVELAN